MIYINSYNFSTTPTIPTGYVIYLNASTSSTGGSVPSPSSNNTAVTTWGPFTTFNSPLYFSSGGPNNKPYVNFKGGAGAGNQGNWMTSSVNCNGTAGNGITLFAYVLNTSGGPFSRFFLAAGSTVSFMGNGQTRFSFEGNLNFSQTNSTYATTGQWMTVCWRSTKSGTSTIKNTFYNGSNVMNYVEASSTSTNLNWGTFSRSEFGDNFNDPYWNGRIYALLLYPRPLTDSEIQTLDTNFRNGTF